jgi:hypothetical protein
MPRKLFVWDIPKGARLPEAYPFPTYRQGDRLFSFANAKGLTGANKTPTGGPLCCLENYLDNNPPGWTGLKRHEISTPVRQLLRQAWDKMAEARGLPMFNLSSGKKTLWFPKGGASGDTVAYTGIDGRKSRRDVCGHRTITRMTGEKFQRYWHFGLEPFPILFPFPILAMKSHVVFTLDGKSITGDAKAQHRARRSQCKDWWNDRWRDLTLAAVEWLAQGRKGIALPSSPSSRLAMEWRPITHQSDIGYEDAAVREAPEEILPTEFDPENDGEDDNELE